MAEEIYHHGGGGGAAKVSISGANTDGTLTLISTGTMYMAGGNNITISQDGNSLTFVGMDNAGATTFRGGVSTGGNTLGTTGTVNNQIVFVGGNNITLSQSANANSATVTISGPNVAGAQTAISGISASDTLYTSGTVLFTGSNLVTVRSSGAGQTVIIDASLAAQTGISSIAADGTTYSSGQVVFVGSNAASVNSSAAGQTLIIDVPVQTVQPEGTIQFGVSSGGNTVGTTGMAAGTGPRLVFVGGNNITLSQSLDAASVSGTITISAGASGAGGIAASLSGNSTSGGAGYSLVSSGTLYLAGGNNVTLSQDGASVTISGANIGGAQTGISGISGSDTVYTSGTVKFTGSNIVTVRSGTGQAIVIDASVVAQTAESNSFGMSNLGNTAGTSGIVSGNQIRYYFAGGNNVTLSQSINGSSGTLTISAGSGAGINASISGNTSGTKTVISSGTMYLAGGNNITLSQEGQSITISGAEGGGAGISTYGNTAGTTGIAGDQLILVGGSNITLSQSIDAGSSNATISIIGASGGTNPYNIVSASGNTDGTLTSFSTGTVVFAGGSNITLSQSSNTITIVGASGGTGVGYTAGISDIGNTSGSTGPVTGRLVLAGMNNITLSQSVDGGSATLSISGPTGGGAGMSTFGNTAGTTGTVGRELVFVGGSNISLSQSVNGASATLTINGATAGGGQTAISGIIASDATYTSGTVSFVGSGIVTVESGTGQQVIINATGGGGGFTAGVSSQGNTAGTTGLVPAQIVFVGGNNITLSQSIDASSATITISGPNTAAQSVQTYNVVSASGNTSGTLTSFSTGTIVFAGGNNITLSQSSNSITISGANVGGAQTGISSIVAADATYTSGQVVFVGSNNITVTSGANQSVIISGPTGGGAGMGNSASGTAGTSGTVGRELYFYPGSNVTLSQSVNGSSGSLTIIGASGGTGAGFVAGMTTDGNTSGDATNVTGRLILVGTNNITLSGSTNAGSMTITLSGPTLPDPTPAASFGVSDVGNTAGNTGLVSDQMVLAGGNNITLSQSTGVSGITVTISGPNTVAQSNQDLVFYATSNTTVSSAGTINASSIILKGNDQLSVGISNGSLIFEAGGADAFTGSQVIGMSNLSNTSGTTGVVSGSAIRYYLAGGNNVTLSQSLNGVSGTVTISAAAQTVQTQGMVSINGSTGAMSFNAGANMSLSTVASNLTFINVLSSSGIAQPVSNVSSAGTLSSRYALADHAHVGVAGLNVSGTASTWVGNVMLSVTNLTLVTGGNSSAGSIGISAAAPGGAGPAVGITNTGNTAGNLFTASNGSVYVQGSNNITASASTAAGASTIWISGPTGGGAGMGTGTNTSGTSGTVGRQLYFYANSNVTLSQSVDGSSASLSINAGGGGGNQTIGMSNVGNTSGDTTPVTGPAVRVVFAGGNNITLSQSTNGSSATVTISAGAAGGATVSEWMAPGVGYSSFTQMGQSSLVLFQVAPPYYVTASRADMFASISASTSSNSSHNGYISLYMGIYTRNASTLSLASSGSAAKSWNVTGSTSSGSVVGWRDLTLPIDVNMTPGRYWVGVISVTNTSNANWFTASNMGLIAVPAAYSGPLGATNASNQFQLGNGVFSAQTAALPASVAFADIVATSASTARPIVNFVNLTI